MHDLYQELLRLKAQGWGLLSHAPDWLLMTVAILVCVGFLLAVFPLLFAFTTWAERKMLARIQNRYGPNRVGPWGLLQPVADGLKVLFKEDIVPARGNKILHFLAPVAVCVPVLLIPAVLPYSRHFSPADLSIGVLFVFAIGAASTPALFMAGWAGRNKYSVLGAMRAVAQMLSYEIPLVLSVVTVVMVVGTLKTSEIVKAQAGSVADWFVWTPWGFAAFVIFLLSAIAEANRSPFDIPEAESELIAGFHTEYSGFKFALFMMAEYLSVIVMSGVAVALFLGGWSGPGTGLRYVGEFLAIFYFMAKMMALVLVVIWIRATWPRLRVDQLMAFSWKVLLPLSLFNILVAAVWHYLERGFGAWLMSAILVVAAYAVLSLLYRRSAVGKRSYRYAQFV